MSQSAAPLSPEKPNENKVLDSSTNLPRPSARHLRDNEAKEDDMKSASTDDKMSEKPMLYGVQEIADYLGMRERQARHQIEKGRIPTFKIGGKICARPTALDAWLEELSRNGTG